MIPQKTMNMLKRMSHREMLDTLHDLVMKSARRMLRAANADFEKRKKKTLCSCPHCGGIGKRNVCVSTSWCQGNYRRADGSYHREEDGTETTQEYKWKICPDCHGTGKVYREE